MASPRLRPKILRSSIRALPDSQGNRPSISAGTGLGEAGLFWDGSEYRIFASEGGHTDFAPRNHLEMDLLDYLLEPT